MKARAFALILAICIIPALSWAQRGGSGGGHAGGGGMRPSNPGNARSSPAPPAVSPGGHAGSPAPPSFRGPQGSPAAPSNGSVVVRPPNALRVIPGGAVPPGNSFVIGNGFGNINHPGGVLPPGLQPLPTITQPLPGVNGAGFVHNGAGVVGRGGSLRGRRNNNVVVLPVPVVVGGYSYYGYDGTAYPVNPSPTVVVGGGDQGTGYYPPDQYSGQGAYYRQTPNQYPQTMYQQQGGIYTVGPNATPPGPPVMGPLAEQQAQAQGQEQQNPITLLVFKDHSIYAATDYWKQGDRLYYLTNYGSKNSIPLDQLDADMTVQLNRERSVPFILAERQP